MKLGWIPISLLILLSGWDCRNAASPTEAHSHDYAYLPKQLEAAPDSSQQAPGSDTTDPEMLVCQAILINLYQACGDQTHPIPQIALSEQTNSMAAFFPRKNVIQIERQAYEVCRSFGADSLNALAVIIAHELSHALDPETAARSNKSKFWAYDRQAGSSIAREKSADIRGVFTAHLAGYRIVPIVPVLIEKLYAAYPRQNRSAAYPSETERRLTAIEVQGMVDTIIQVFEAANYLLAMDQSDLAMACYDHLLQIYKSPEIWNNLGIACAREALLLPGNDGFAYPFELNWQLRLSRPRGQSPTQDDALQRQALLRRAQMAFSEAVRLSPTQFTAQSNLLCARIISGDVKNIFSDIEQLRRNAGITMADLDRLELISALAATRAGNQRMAEQLLKNLIGKKRTGITQIAEYNLEILKNGVENAALGHMHLPCPRVPEAFGLPSVFSLRRLAQAFEGLSIGNDQVLTLAWEIKENQQLFKARMGADRYCIWQRSAVSERPKRPLGATTNLGTNDVSGTTILTCDNQYFEEIKAGRRCGLGVFYAYRKQPVQ